MSVFLLQTRFEYGFPLYPTALERSTSFAYRGRPDLPPGNHFWPRVAAIMYNDSGSKLKQSSYNGFMQLDRHQNALLLGFITVSLLLHLLLIYLVPELSLFPPPPAREPVVVEIRPGELPKVRDRELDLPPDTPETSRTRPAKRLGPVDRQVERAAAPKGDAPEDSRPAVVRPAIRPSPPPMTAQAPAKAEKTPAGEVAEKKAVGEGPAPAESQPKAERPPDVSMKTLMASAERAAENVAAQQMAEMRRKYREEVEQGDAVWLDTEKDILISFFQRFRDNIYGVWNYPRRAAERGEEGTCLLKITINRDGTVKEVRLMEGSGHGDLDDEAMAAVRKGAPYGKLPSAYKEEILNIFAFFKYNLRQVNFRRPGDIY
jgi:protein TonB